MKIYSYLCKIIQQKTDSKMNKILIFIVLATGLLMAGSCSKKKTEPVVETVDTIPMLVTRIQECSRLYTAECQIHKIITHSDKMNVSGQFLKDKINIDLPFGERRVAIPMDATVKAYVDFGGFAEENVQRNGQKITVILPDPKIIITSTRINHSEIRQHVPWMRSNFSDAELTNYEKQGRTSIVKLLPELGLVEKARLSAAHTLVPMLTAMGFKEQDITITFRKNLSEKDSPKLLERNDERGLKQ